MSHESILEHGLKLEKETTIVDNFSNIADVLTSDIAQTVIMDKDKPPAFLNFLNSIQGFGVFAVFISMALKIIAGSWKVIHNVSIEKNRPISTRVMKILFILLATAVILSALMFPTVILFLGVVAATITACENLWDVGEKIISRFFNYKNSWRSLRIKANEDEENLQTNLKKFKQKGDWKNILKEFFIAGYDFEQLREEIENDKRTLKYDPTNETLKKGLAAKWEQLRALKIKWDNTRDHNKPLDYIEDYYIEIMAFRNEEKRSPIDLAQKINGLLMSLAILVGVALLITPLAPVGGIILLSVFIYGLASAGILLATTKLFAKPEKLDLIKYLSESDQEVAGVAESAKNSLSNSSYTKVKAEVDQKLRKRDAKKVSQDKTQLVRTETQQEAPKSFFSLPKLKSPHPDNSHTLKAWSNARNGF